MLQNEIRDARKASGKYWAVWCDGEVSLFFESEKSAHEFADKFTAKYSNRIEVKKWN